MTTKKPKNLTLSDLNKYASKLDEKKTVYILDGERSVVISKTFKETELQKLAIEYMQYINELEQRKDNTPEALLIVPNLIYALTCKHFTNLPFQLRSLDELIVITNNLLNLGIIEQLFSGDPNLGFDKDEIEKVNVTLNKVAKGVGQVIGELAITDALSSFLEDTDRLSEEVDSIG